MFRKSMALLVLTAGVTLAPLSAGAGSMMQDGTDYALLTEQIEIMRRVWTREVNDRFAKMAADEQEASAGEDGESGMPGATGTAQSGGGAGAGASTPGALGTRSVAPSAGGGSGLFGEGAGGGSTWVSSEYAVAGTLGTVWRNGHFSTSDTRGLYLPGHGVVYSTELRVPYRVVSTEEAQSDEMKSDAWDAARQDVRGNGTDPFLARVYRTGDGSTKAQQFVVDEAYVDAAVDAIVKSVAKYGARIDQLPGNESITVAIEINAGGSSNPFVVTSGFGTTNRRSSGHKQRLVIEIPRSALGSDADSESDASKVRREARITRF